MRTSLIILVLLAACHTEQAPEPVTLAVVASGSQSILWEEFDLGPVPTAPSAEFANNDPGQCAQSPCEDRALVDALEDDYTLSIDTCVDCTGPGCPGMGQVCTRGTAHLSDTIRVFWQWDGMAWVLDHAYWPTGLSRRYRVDADMLPLPIPPAP